MEPKILKTLDNLGSRLKLLIFVWIPKQNRTKDMYEIIIYPFIYMTTYFIYLSIKHLLLFIIIYNLLGTEKVGLQFT